MKRNFFITLTSSVYIFILGLVAWILGKPFIFPSLGPTAYLLAFDHKFSHTPKVVIGGHAAAVAGGLISSYFITQHSTLMSISEPFQQAGFELGIGAVVAIAITVFLMLWLNVSHPPACATTLIISLGIMPLWSDGLIILASVSIMYGVYVLNQKMRNR
ncbi:HPP family protein [Rhodohalobacter halophilus]|uniref:HPP family protein n=1 Tax=Rhodohalobacter halophilus TaxID=1812810 RepID=UPI00083FB5BE|nr:HPP family protein [Rhodohalobacter halophilus]